MPTNELDSPDEVRRMMIADEVTMALAAGDGESADRLFEQLLADVRGETNHADR